MRDIPWKDKEYIEDYLRLRKNYDGVAKGEVEYLIEKFHLIEGMYVLDLGCGYGRHSIEFAKMGMKVTGVDISDEFIRIAKENSKGLDIEWVNKDVLLWKPERSYDLVINMFTSILGEIGSPENDIIFLKKIREALKENGNFVITTLNAYRQAWKDNRKFDAIHSEIVWRWVGGKSFYQQPIRLYTPMELKWMFKIAGLKIDGIFGANAPGDIVDEKPFTVKNIEIVVIGSREY